MILHRMIPCLLLRGRGFVKTRQFNDPVYLGDPINIVKIFNDKEVDELVILDIEATPLKKKPNFDFLKDIASESFMPLGYGGGIRNLEDMAALFNIGFEKICLNTFAVEKPEFVGEAAREFGSQSIVVSIDVRKKPSGRYEVYTLGGRKATGMDPVTAARMFEDQGAGEIIITSIDREGTYKGYDLALVRSITSALNIPVICQGGAGSLEHLVEAVRTAGVSAVAAGSFFVFHGPHRAVLINVPSHKEFERALNAPSGADNMEK